MEKVLHADKMGIQTLREHGFGATYQEQQFVYKNEIDVEHFEHLRDTESTYAML